MTTDPRTDLFVPPAAEGLPLAALDSATVGANRLDAAALTPTGRNFLAHALVQLARDGWLRAEPGEGFEAERDRETPEPLPAVVSVPPPADRATLAEVRKLVRRLAAHAEGFRDVLDDSDRDPWAKTVRADIAALTESMNQADEERPLSPDYEHPECGFHWHGRDDMDIPMRDGQPVCPRCESRRLAAESTVAPPPALTEEGRLRAQVEVLQQDAERDQGLAKVGARCMRDGHQGLIERGRMVLEGWRFALSTALDLGTGAPWEAIHERAKELRRLAAEQPTETQAPRRRLTPSEHSAAWHAIEGAAGEEGADPGTVLKAVLWKLGIDAPDEHERPAVVERPDTQTREARVGRCSAVMLRVHHAPHGWEPQPGMDPVHCPGYPQPAP